MNKNIKKIIAIVLAIGTISPAMPRANVSFLTTKAYAASENDVEHLENLKLYDSAGNSIKLYKNSDYTSKIDSDEIDEDETYYVTTSSNSISINTEGPSDRYVKIFKGTSSTTRGKDVGDDIKLSTDSATTTFTVRVYSEEKDNNVQYNDTSDVLSTYRIKVKYTGSSLGTATTTSTTNATADNSDTTAYDAIYLDRLSVNSNMINLSEEQTKYSYNVNSDVEEVDVRATPEDDDYDVSIDGKDVDDSDVYKTKVKLDKGENDIEIKIEHNKEMRVYTLVINRGSTTTSQVSIDSNMSANDYDDIYLFKLGVNGNMLDLSKSEINYTYDVNSDTDKAVIRSVPTESSYKVTLNDKELLQDDNYQKTVDLNNGTNVFKIEIEDVDKDRVYKLVINRGAGSSDNAQTGSHWINNNGVWKYVDETGNFVENSLIGNYYLNAQGNMATEWLNINGNWYYFGADGAKKTGWQKVNGIWYYLDTEEGKMKTGWYRDFDGNWYYLNGDGSMAYNTIIGGYRLGSSGALIK